MISSTTPLQTLLKRIRTLSRSEAEKGRAFEDLCRLFLQTDPAWRNQYARVQPYADWAAADGAQWGLAARDTGIDLVASTHGGEHHAIQCKCYAADHVVGKADIDSFLADSGHEAFSARLLIDTTTRPWGSNAEETLRHQRTPVARIDLHALENSRIDWARFDIDQPAAPLTPQHGPRPHQSAAITDVLAGLQSADRGKLIMACGTGKTFTALKIAEQQAGAGKQVLFLVPSLALLSQTLSEWSQHSTIPLTAFAVCSDSEVGKQRARKRDTDDDTLHMALHELAWPATTSAAALAKQHAARQQQQPGNMCVVFSTYHSIEVIARAQKDHGLPAFDLAICDEAHRTTGQTFDSEEESHFVRIHDNRIIQAKKRLYMTATPRIYSAEAQNKSKESDITLYSMDDPAIYGNTLHTLNFSSAVEQELLAPYKVIVLTVEESEISQRLQELLRDDNNSLRMDDAAKIVGCFKALAKDGLTELGGDSDPMRRAVAFCQVIDRERSATTRKGNKTGALQIAGMFQHVVEEYQRTAHEDERVPDLICQADHVHGGMGASEKTQKLNWLKHNPDGNTCRILTNVRCLSEGVDVPALDAVLFLTPRDSQVEVVQSVGRVMRRTEGKQRGYIILPVVIPYGVAPHKALDDNKTYKVVWQVLQALRAHDDEFDRFINRIDLLGSDAQKIEVIAVTGLAERNPQHDTDKQKHRNALSQARGGQNIGAPEPSSKRQDEMHFSTGELERAILAKVVQKVGNRAHWEQWANDIARIAQIQIGRIQNLLNDSTHTNAQAAFADFTAQLHQHINSAISRDDIIEMLAQHLITLPVFDALFGGDAFSRHNPISQALQTVTDLLLQDTALDKERQALDSFYADVRKRSQGIDKPEARQKLIVTLYDQFFSRAFPRTVEKHGIVYTPIEVVDFILHSVAHVLQTRFGKTFASPDVQVLDPFTGTGTFIARLIASGLIAPEHLPRVYAGQLHATEILLLPYYIAAVNIESTFAQACPEAPYTPFPGILLADTFNIPVGASGDFIEDQKQAALAANNARRKRQMDSKITVIVGNPPYSVGQRRENDNNKNIGYPALDSRIAKTYAATGNATSKKSLRDSYVRALRWASDRIDASTGGIIGFVTNAGWLDSAAADGLRTCLAKEFSSLYVFHLRGDARTQGDQRKKEGGNVFDSGSRAPIAISILIKHPQTENTEHRPGQIYFHDIGDYLTREKKLEKIAELSSIAGIATENLWHPITPDAHGDWLNQRTGGFAELMPMGDGKLKNKPRNSGLFENYSLGINTNRDAWCNNPCRTALLENIRNLVACYEQQRAAFNQRYGELSRAARQQAVDGFIDTDPTKISWSSSLLADFTRDKPLAFNQHAPVISLYRPFNKGWLYYDRMLNHRVGQMPQIFPLSSVPEQEHETQPDLLSAIGTQHSTAQHSTAQHSTAYTNRLICVSGVGAKSFSVLMCDQIPSLDLMGKTQCFPETLYGSTGKPREAITDATLKNFRQHYGEHSISKTQIFEYLYGILHSPQYRDTFSHNLIKELPRIPFASNFSDFCAFSGAGKQLGDLHVNYESTPLFDGVQIEIHKPGCVSLDDLCAQDFRVEKMKYGKGADGKKDLGTIHVNRHITVRHIPQDVYQYTVNGRSAIDWVVERQRVRTDKASGIVADANRYAIETLGNPRYPLELLLRLISVSLQTLNIVRGLPELFFIDKYQQFH